MKRSPVKDAAKKMRATLEKGAIDAVELTWPAPGQPEGCQEKRATEGKGGTPAKNRVSRQCTLLHREIPPRHADAYHQNRRTKDAMPRWGRWEFKTPNKQKTRLFDAVRSVLLGNTRKNGKSIGQNQKEKITKRDLKPRAWRRRGVPSGSMKES